MNDMNVTHSICNAHRFIDSRGAKNLRREEDDGQRGNYPGKTENDHDSIKSGMIS